MKIISNKEYNKLITEIEVLKEIRENNLWYFEALQDKISLLEREIGRLHGVVAQQNKLLDQRGYFDE